MGSVVKKNPNELKNHPANLEIYGDTIDDEMLASMKDGKQLTPIVLAANGETIVSGHRRMQGARKLKWKTVDCIIRKDLADETDIVEALLNANQQRDKTAEQKAREYKRRKEIESVRAMARMKHRENKDETGPSAKVALGSGRASDIAAEKSDLSPPTARKAEKVVDAIDKVEEKGDAKAAEVIRDRMNNGSVASANRIADHVENLCASVKTALANNMLSLTDSQIIALAKLPKGKQNTIAQAVRSGSTWDAELKLNTKAQQTQKPAKKKQPKGNEKKRAYDAFGIVVRYLDSIDKKDQLKKELDAVMKWLK